MTAEAPWMRAAVRRVVDALVRGDYEELERMSGGVRLSAEEMAGAVRAYGRTLVALPDEGFDNLDVVELEDARPRAWSVHVDLWTAEEGRSDLTLELTLRERGGDDYEVEIDDIHVL